MSHSPIRIVDPCGPAFERMKDLLFRPFELGRWFAIGFTAWLATLGETGFGGTGGNFNGANNPGQPPAEFNEMFRRAREFFFENLTWIIPAICGAILLTLAIYLTLLWVSSRGQFMFLHNVALNRADVSGLWTRYQTMGNSLLRFRLVVFFISACVFVPLAGVLGFCVYTMVRAGGPETMVLMVSVFSGLLILVGGIATAIVGVLTRDFLAPIMWLRGVGSRAAWGELVGLVGAHLGEFTLYLLFLVVLAIGSGLVVLAAVVVTCCIAGCLLAIPFIGTVLMLPVLVFLRAYSAGFLAQFGEEWDVFRAPVLEGDAGGVPGLG